MREHVALQGDVLGLFLEGGLVVRDLLGREGFDRGSGLCEFRLSGEFGFRERFGSRIADLAGAKSASAALEVDVRVGAEFSAELFDEVNRFELRHSGFVLMVNNLSVTSARRVLIGAICF